MLYSNDLRHTGHGDLRRGLAAQVQANGGMDPRKLRIGIALLAELGENAVDLGAAAYHAGISPGLIKHSLQSGTIGGVAVGAKDIVSLRLNSKSTQPGTKIRYALKPIGQRNSLRNDLRGAGIHQEYIKAHHLGHRDEIAPHMAAAAHYQQRCHPEYLNEHADAAGADLAVALDFISLESVTATADALHSILLCHLLVRPAAHGALG